MKRLLAIACIALFLSCVPTPMAHAHAGGPLGRILRPPVNVVRAIRNRERKPLIRGVRVVFRFVLPCR